MVQVLPYVPSFIERLQPYLKQATGDIASSLEQRAAMKGLEALLGGNKQPTAVTENQPGMENQPQAPPAVSSSPLENLTPMNAVQTFKLAEQALGPQGAKVLIDNLMQNQKLRDKEAIDIRAEERKEGRDIRSEKRKQELPKESARQELKPSFDRLRELAHEVGGTWSWKALVAKIPYTEGASKREELDKLGIWTADSVYTKFNKGTLAQVKWEDIKNQFAPNSRLSDAENDARINAMERIMGLPANISADKMESVIKKEQKGIDSIDKKQQGKKAEIGAKLTKDILEEWKKEGLTREEAEARAKEMGYEY